MLSSVFSRRLIRPWEVSCHGVHRLDTACRGIESEQQCSTDNVPLLKKGDFLFRDRVGQAYLWVRTLGMLGTCDLHLRSFSILVSKLTCNDLR